MLGLRRVPIASLTDYNPLLTHRVKKRVVGSALCDLNRAHNAGLRRTLLRKNAHHVPHVCADGLCQNRRACYLDDRTDRVRPRHKLGVSRVANSFVYAVD